MKNFRLPNNRPLVCLSLLTTIGVTTALAWAQTRADQPAPKMIPIISDYRQWKLVNQTPAPMDPAVAILCVSPIERLLPSPPNLSKTAVMGSGGPHEKKWINVFVNSIGEEAMLKAKQPRFPVGTVIVKEKLAIPPSKGKSAAPAKPASDQQPELLTVMIKRESGYDKKNGDWEYMATDGPGHKVGAQGKLPSCQSCHRAYASTDYVVRSYLPASVEEALRDEEPMR